MVILGPDGGCLRRCDSAVTKQADRTFQSVSAGVAEGAGNRYGREGDGQLDVLWAVDNSASMGASQNAVATAAAEAGARLQNAGIDFRTAAVT